MTIASGPITQICWVTDDIEATERLLSDQFGVAAWTRIPDVEFGPDSTTLRGEPVLTHVRARRPEVAALLQGLLGAAVAVEGGWTAAVDTALAHPDAVAPARTPEATQR